jgi:2,3-bisphosphoglycerate-independent phosphoglycerate mutase
MKYAIVIPDGAADEPVDVLGGKTPLQAARKPEMDRIAREGVLGRSRNVPDRFLPASDVATLSLFGYDPVKYYTGRAPLEAVAIGVELGPEDWAVRCNLMYVEEGKLADFTAGHITSEEGGELIRTLESELAPELNAREAVRIEFVPGVSYRNLMVVRGSGLLGESTTSVPPHDHPDQPAKDYLPTGAGSEKLRWLMEQATPILAAHPVNKSRVAAGRKPANAIWLWGQGRAPSVPKFEALHGVRGAIISAVDLVRGTGQLAGWHRIDVPGATGYLDTDYAAKGRHAIEALKDYDLICVHVEAPDEASHEGRADAKVEAIERIDREIVGPVHEALKAHGDYRIVVSPDHSTMIRTRAHDRAPVAWAMAGAGLGASGLPYDEIAAAAGGGPFLDEGWRMIGEQFLKGTR